MIRALLSLVPAWAWAAFLALLAGSAVTYHLAALQRVRVEVRAEIEAQQAEQYRLRNISNAKVTDGFHKQQARTAAAAARAAARTDELRKLVDQYAADAAAGSGADDPTAVAGVILGECIERRRAVAKEAAGLAEKVAGLQGYARLCVGR